MNRALALVSLLLAVSNTACGVQGSQAPVLPTFLAPTELAAPAPNEAYPTSQAPQTNASETVSGFTVSLQRAWRDGKQVHAAVCFTMPDSSDWTVWSAHFDYAGQAVTEFSASLLSKQDAGAGAPAQRCDELVFYVPPDADLTAATLTIDSLGAYPTADEYCSLYLPKIQQALNDRGIAITLDCSDANGAPAMRITSKPDGMSQEQADQLVYSDEFYTVKGPWTFSATFSQ